jgi:hypothetical protein
METSADSNTIVSQERFAQSYEATKEEILALPESACQSVNLEAQAAAMGVIGALPRARTLRASIVYECPRFDITLLERLETYAGALWHAQTLVDISSKPPAHVQELAKRAVAARDVVITDISLLIKRGLLPSSCLGNLEGAVG